MDNFNSWMSATSGKENADEAKKVKIALLEKLAAKEAQRSANLQKLQGKRLEERKIMLGIKNEAKRATAIRQSLRDVKTDFEDSFSSFEEMKRSILELPDTTEELVTDDGMIDSSLKSYQEFQIFMNTAKESVINARKKYDLSNVFGDFLLEKNELKRRTEEAANNHAKFIELRDNLKTAEEENSVKSKDLALSEEEEKSLKEEVAKLEEEHSALNDKIAEKKASLVDMEFTEARIGNDSSFDEEMKRMEEQRKIADGLAEELRIESEKLSTNLTELNDKLKEAQENIEKADLEIEKSKEEVIEFKTKKLQDYMEKMKNEVKARLISELKEKVEVEKISINSLRVQIAKAFPSGITSIEDYEAEVEKLVETTEKLNDEKAQLENAKLQLETEYGAILSVDKKPKNKKTVVLNRTDASEKEEDVTSVLDESELSSLGDNQSIRTDMSLTPKKAVAATHRGVSNASVDPFDPFARTEPILTSTPIVHPSRRNQIAQEEQVQKAQTKKAGRGRGRGGRRGK